MYEISETVREVLLEDNTKIMYINSTIELASSASQSQRYANSITSEFVISGAYSPVRLWHRLRR